MNIITVKGLKAPAEYWSLSEEQLRAMCNGCGPEKWGWIVPDRFRLIGVDFNPSCNIHDYCYVMQLGKQFSDNLFLENNLYCASKCYFGCGPIADHYAFIYYLFVKNLGEKFYLNSGQ